MHADDVYSLESRKVQLKLSLDERRHEIEVHRDSLRAELRLVRDDIHRCSDRFRHTPSIARPCILFPRRFGRRSSRGHGRKACCRLQSAS